MTADELIAFEADIMAAFNRGEIRAPVHLDGGSETALIKIFENIKRTDYVCCSWRAHYRALLHGIPPEKVKAEIMAGRSIALCFPEHRFLSSAIVGGIIPIALGIALSIKRRGGDEKVWVFSGDMTSRSGIWHECRQYAEGHRLPIHFVIEDNLKSVCTDTREVWGEPLDYYNPWRYETTFRYDAVWPHSGTGNWVSWT